MCDKEFQVEMDERRFLLRAEKEGDGRYLLRMQELDAPERPRTYRIGYVLGGGREWQAELGGRTIPIKTLNSFIKASKVLAEWAMRTMPMFKVYRKPEPRCDGCRHNLYFAPGGVETKRTPHSRCSWFNADIPMVIQKLRGCDGRLSPEWIRSEIPKGCPTYIQPSLF